MINHLEKDLRDREQFLRRIEKEKKKALQRAPQGRLRYSKKGKYVSYYIRKDPQDVPGTYIRTKDRKLAQTLAQRDYDETVLKLAQMELRQIQGLLQFYRAGYVEVAYDTLSVPRRDLVLPVELPEDVFVKAWKELEYEKKPMGDNVPMIMTANGEQVRSKSELIIADTLDRFGIVYRYEAPLYLEGFGTVHPDFTVLNARLRKEFVWEHLGMMDDPGYAEQAVRRIRAYHRAGFYEGDNLILTWETAQQPLNSQIVTEIIRQYLL